MDTVEDALSQIPQRQLNNVPQNGIASSTEVLLCVFPPLTQQGNGLLNFSSDSFCCKGFPPQWIWFKVYKFLTGAQSSSASLNFS